MKYFITSDVHSYYTELMTALNKEGFDISTAFAVVSYVKTLWKRALTLRL